MCLFACLLFEALRFHDPLSFCLPFIFFCLKIFAALQSIVVVCTLYSVHITLTCRCFFSIYTYSIHLIFNTNSTMRNSLPIELLLADNKEKEKNEVHPKNHCYSAQVHGSWIVHHHQNYYFMLFYFCFTNQHSIRLFRLQAMNSRQTVATQLCCYYFSFSMQCSRCLFLSLFECT